MVFVTWILLGFPMFVVYDEKERAGCFITLSMYFLRIEETIKWHRNLERWIK